MTWREAAARLLFIVGDALSVPTNILAHLALSLRSPLLISVVLRIGRVPGLGHLAWRLFPEEAKRL